MISKLKPHLPYASALLVLTIIVLNSWITPGVHSLGDVVTYYYPRAVLLHQSITQYHDFLPLWNPYIFSGDTLIGKAAFLNPFSWFGPLLLLLGPLGALRWTVMLDMFMAGLFMYLLVDFLTGSRRAAFISAIAYMFSGFFLLTVVFYGWVVFGNGYALLPLLALFVLKALKENQARNAIFAGIVLGIMVIAGSGIEFLYATVFIMSALLVNLLFGGFRQKIIQSLLIGGILIVVCVGLSAFKLLPVYEFSEGSSRAEFTWSDASSRSLRIGEMYRLVEPSMPRPFQEPSPKAGVVVFLLAAFGIYMQHRSRHMLTFILTFVLSLLLATGSFLLYLFWKLYPGWHGMRYADRALLLFAFSAAVLAGFGADFLLRSLKKPGQGMVAFSVIAALVLADLALLGSGGLSNGGDMRYQSRDIAGVVAANELLNNLSVERQSSIFRVHSAETPGIDWGIEFYTVPLRLEGVTGYDTQWQSEYLRDYLNVQAVADPAKFLGALNVKYVISRANFSWPGLGLAGKFNNCTICFPEEPAIQKAWGPYLYRNYKFAPRAFVTDSALLALGERKEALQAANLIFSDPGFNHASSVLVIEKNSKSIPSDFVQGELTRYRALVVTKRGYDPLSTKSLAAYSGTGGVIIPDILKGETAMSPEKLTGTLMGLEGTTVPVPDSSIRDLSFSIKEVTLPGNSQGKFLVLSERYAMFPGWTASADGRELPLLRANGVITAVYLDKDYDKIVFEYKPKSFVMGRIITLLTLAVLAGLLLYRKLR